ncbi:MAG: sugar nucleotide-binding protein [Planctomycetota bacterium]
MHVLVTGLNGTVAPVLRDRLVAAGCTVTGWDRAAVATDDPAACEDFLDRVQPDAVCHVATGAESWAAWLAEHCHRHDRHFLHTGSASVFGQDPSKPNSVGDPRTATDDYGQYKIRCEDAILAANENAIIARLGWQIGDLDTPRGGGGNQMLEFLHRAAENGGSISASTKWTPATSLLTDTCDALWRLLERGQAGVYHLDSNAECALSFYEIVTRLKAKIGANWQIEESNTPADDQRLIDNRVEIASLTDRI